MLIDTHSHLNFRAFEKDLAEVINRSLKNNTWMINVGSNYLTSQKAVEIAQKYEKGVYAAIGLHPIHLATGLVKIKKDPIEEKEWVEESQFDYEKYRNLAQFSKVVAIGETGLDYYWKPKTKGKLALFKEKQKEIFLKQLELAKELNLPVIFHCRMAHQDLLEILNAKCQMLDAKITGVVHSFTGNWEEAKKFLEMGFYLGFTGIIFKLNLNEIIEKTPLEKILVETDCPYLPPTQLKIERNEPMFVKYIAQKFAELKNLSLEKVCLQTTENAKRLFKL